jgi:predicted O-methyltransferase YrrM
MKLAQDTFAGLHGTEVDLFKSLLAGAEGDAVEIGCLDGFSTACLLEITRYNLTTIDPFIPDFNEPHLIGSKERFWENVDPWRDRVELIVDYSWDVVTRWKTLLDFLFIDGDHRYMSVMRDFEQWVRFLKVGGILAMHDSRMFRPKTEARFHPGPSMVARDLVYNKPEHWEILGEAFSLTVARKKVAL